MENMLSVLTPKKNDHYVTILDFFVHKQSQIKFSSVISDLFFVLGHFLMPLYKNQPHKQTILQNLILPLNQSWFENLSCNQIIILIYKWTKREKKMVNISQVIM